MDFVQHNAVILQEFGVVPGFGKQNTVGHKLDHCIFGSVIVKTHFVAHRLPKFGLHFLRCPPRQTGCRQPPGLGAADAPVTAAARRQSHLGQLSGFA